MRGNNSDETVITADASGAERSVIPLHRKPGAIENADHCCRRTDFNKGSLLSPPP